MSVLAIQLFERSDNMFRHLKSYAKWMSPPVVLIAGLLCASPCVAAQVKTGSTKAAPTKAAPAKAAPATESTTSETKPVAQFSAKATREEIMKSAAWRDTLHQFDSWLTSQTLYDVDQVKQIRLRLEAGIKRMSPVQMQRFVTEMHAKLAILEGDQTKDAEETLTETLAVASPVYARKVRQQLPDVLSMNATQIEQKLTAITSKRQTAAQMQKSFEYARQRQLAFNQAQATARQRDQHQQAAERADAANNSSQQNNFTQAADYYPYSDNAFDTGYDGYAGVTWSVGTNRF
jgi:hypothetical protein